MAPTTAKRVPPGPALFSHDAALAGTTVGCDEAGRGCLAGPLVVAGVRFRHDSLEDTALEQMRWLNDSKRVSERRRAHLYDAIHEHADAIVVRAATAAEIDAEGIHVANLRLMREALLALTPADVLLVDGFDLGPLAPAHIPLVKGDSRSASIAAASIIAKTHRDRLMVELEERYPGYGFDRHVGYPTPEHKAAITRRGITPAHRRSFRLL